jgi:enoyl-CoA hydratase
MPVHAERHGAVGHLVLDRPERAHAYDRAHLDALLDAAVSLARDCAVIVARSTGDGAFCGGADLRELRAASPLDALELRSQRVFTTIARLPCVTIAAVHGPAVAGGFELALACDLRVAGPRATFSLPETSLGIVPSAGGTTRLARLVGPGRAKEVILGGATIDATTAAVWGLVARVAPDPRAEAQAWALRIASRDGVATRAAKELLDATEDDRGLSRERYAEALLYARRRDG